MKKLLIASTALVATAGIAAADVTVLVTQRLVSTQVAMQLGAAAAAAILLTQLKVSTATLV